MGLGYLFSITEPLYRDSFKRIKSMELPKLHFVIKIHILENGSRETIMDKGFNIILNMRFSIM
jgi:hypothetical protein